MRQIGHRRVITGTALGAASLLLSTGCSFEFSIGGPDAVSAEQVAEQSSEMLAEEVGQTPDGFTCPEDLPAEVGAEIRCELTADGQTLGVTVTTTSVDGDDVQWDVEVDDAPAGDTPAEDAPGDDAGGGSGGDGGTAASDGVVPAEQVAQQSATQLEAVVGRAPEDFSCPQGLPAEVGAEIRCNLVDGGMNYGVTITTTSVDGTDVQWDIEVDDQPL
ncbi:DUF4333 domain-containing protein [Nocardiopsis sp. HUAS JQ3]|uniref:DUF4333 domain-containing protein n=1 Tax=Nocardiopsis sp. HUAS JQ3 TaxID=3061629 RepID=UPI0023A9C016|nr:DUF4333 domain-containing protein [Nocardiopsis sp. HUAS JQ3]WDZ91545.1 DUF4333 domain-containing protein [Nocardiopsis sp. HUAS JQ3]